MRQSRRRFAADRHSLPADAAPQLEDRSYLAYLRPTPQPFLHFASGHFPAATLTQPHSHPCIALHGCLQGPLVLRTTQGEATLEAGVFYLIGPDVRHSWRNSGRHTAATLGMLIDAASPGRWPASSAVTACCSQLREQVGGLHRFATAQDPELHRSFWLAADHLTAETPREPAILAGVLLTLLGQLAERLRGDSHSSGSEQSMAQQIRRLLLARVRERLSLSQIASELDVSSTRLKQQFRTAFGCGVMTYFNQLKIYQAKRLLGDPHLTVEQISEQLGFSSPSYFSRAFVKHVGESPTAYRQRQAEG